ncbi:MAG: hypothetical protein HY716_13770 [Planctomycetes bacterium]|nr:hypothetical protein [Planctomycetota bacterium]
MPIRKCSKCGLKVLVDAVEGDDASFACRRCTGAPSAAPAAAPPAPAPPLTAKKNTAKVECPACHAPFSAAVPTRPAKGVCPLCKKDLVLLPDATIQLFESFNLSTWKIRQSMGKESAAEPFPEPAVAPPGGEPDLSDLGGQSILDLGGLGGETMSQPVSESVPAGAAAEPPEIGDQTIFNLGGTAMSSAPRESPSGFKPEGLGSATPKAPQTTRRPATKVVTPAKAAAHEMETPLDVEIPPPADAAPPAPVPSKAERLAGLSQRSGALHRRPVSDSATEEEELPKSSPVKVALAAMLLVLPLAAGAFLASRKDEATSKFLNQVNETTEKGFKKLHTIVWGEPPAPPEPPPSLPPAPADPAPEPSTPPKLEEPPTPKPEEKPKPPEEKKPAEEPPSGQPPKEETPPPPEEGNSDGQGS